MSSQDYLAICRAATASADVLPPRWEGCTTHDQTEERVQSRWEHVTTDEKSVAVCACCCGPCLLPAFVCSRCEGADIEELRKGSGR